MSMSMTQVRMRRKDIPRLNDLVRRERLHNQPAGVRFLLDRYQESLQEKEQDVEQEVAVVQMATPAKRVHTTLTTSTPASLAKRRRLDVLPPGVSDISSASEGRPSPAISGIQSIASPTASVSTPQQITSDHGSTILEQSQAHQINPNDHKNMTIEVVDEGEDDDDDDVEVGEHDHRRTSFMLRPLNCPADSDMEDADKNDTIISVESEWKDGDDVEGDMTLIEDDDGIKKIGLDEVGDAVVAETLLVYRDQLLQLARKKPPTICSECQQSVKLDYCYLGSAITIQWVCPQKHVVYAWCSQPLLKRNMPAGNLLLASSIAVSGNNFQKIELMAKVMNLRIIHHTAYYAIQTHYILPCVTNAWKEHQQELLEEVGDRELCVLGDGRMDSPGYCAQYCTYSLMDNDTKKILVLTTVDKRETNRKSQPMEKLGLEKSLDFLLQAGCKVVEIVTDAHMAIAAMLRTEIRFMEIFQSLDVWHAAKNLGKKVTEAGNHKDSKELHKWAGVVVNHFWHCCSAAKSVEEFKGLWGELVHHCVNEHQWTFAIPGGYNRCGHIRQGEMSTPSQPGASASPSQGVVAAPSTSAEDLPSTSSQAVQPTPSSQAAMEMSEEPMPTSGNAQADFHPLPEGVRDWLKPGTPAHKKIRSIVFDRRLQGNFQKFIRCRSTAELESFHQLILMYASKRISFTPPVYKMKCLLAALDHNYHVDREAVPQKDGVTPRSKISWNKKSGRYSTTDVKKGKTYGHLVDIMKKIFHKQLLSLQGPYRQVTWSPNDPRRLGVVAPKPAPPTHVVAAEKKSRFSVQ